MKQFFKLCFKRPFEGWIYNYSKISIIKLEGSFWQRVYSVMFSDSWACKVDYRLHYVEKLAN